MKKFITAFLLLISALFIMSACSDSSSSNTPPFIAEGPEVGTYKITRIQSVSGATSPFDTNLARQILAFNGEVSVDNTFAVVGKYQIVGYSEFTDRPDDQTTAGKYFTYNKIELADARTAFNNITEGSKYEFDASVDGVTMRFSIEKTYPAPLGINYVGWNENPNDKRGNPFYTNTSFYDSNGVVLPFMLIANYMITEATITKAGQTDTIISSETANELVGELTVAVTVANSVTLDITLKMQIDPALAVNTSFQGYTYKKLADTLPLVFPDGKALYSDAAHGLNAFLEFVFPQEGMTLTQGDPISITYSPKQRVKTGNPTPNDTFIDVDMGEGATLTLKLTKIMDSKSLASLAKTLEDTPYWN